MFFGWGKRSKNLIECPLCQQSNDAEEMTCGRCGYQLGRAGNQQIDQKLQGKASDLFTALMDEVEEEVGEGPTVDWSQSTFTMDDVTIEVSQYDDEHEVELSTAPSFAKQFEDMPDDAKTVLPSNLESHVKREELLDDVDDYQEVPVPRVVPDEDYPIVEAIPDEDLPMVEAVPDEDLPMVEAVSEDEFQNVPESAEVVDDVEFGSVEEAGGDGGDPVTSMGEDELLSLTNAELRSMLSNIGAPTSGKKKILVDRLLSIGASIVEEETHNEEGSEEILIDDHSGLEAKDYEEVGANETEYVVLPTQPPTIPDIPYVDDLGSQVKEDDVESVSSLPEIDAVLESPVGALEKNSYWPWTQTMPWIERDIAIKLKQAMEEARGKNMNKARDLLDEAGPHLGERTRLLFPVCRLLQALGRGDEVQGIIAGAEEIHPSDPSVADARYRLGV